jgi:hypothetical protein
MYKNHEIRDSNTLFNNKLLVIWPLTVKIRIGRDRNHGLSRYSEPQASSEGNHDEESKKNKMGA